MKLFVEADSLACLLGGTKIEEGLDGMLLLTEAARMVLGVQGSHLLRCCCLLLALLRLSMLLLLLWLWLLHRPLRSFRAAGPEDRVQA